MKYEFEDSQGNVVELDMRMSEAPAIGDIITHDGVTLRRIASIPQVDAGTCRGQYPYVSHALPRKLAGCQTTRDGKPIIKSKRHERNVMSQHGYAKD
jgi:hypothetical protein